MKNKTNVLWNPKYKQCGIEGKIITIYCLQENFLKLISFSRNYNIDTRKHMYIHFSFKSYYNTNKNMLGNKLQSKHVYNWYVYSIINMYTELPSSWYCTAFASISNSMYLLCIWARKVCAVWAIPCICGKTETLLLLYNLISRMFGAIWLQELQASNLCQNKMNQIPAQQLCNEGPNRVYSSLLNCNTPIGLWLLLLKSVLVSEVWLLDMLLGPFCCDLLEGAEFPAFWLLPLPTGGSWLCFPS